MWIPVFLKQKDSAVSLDARSRENTSIRLSLMKVRRSASTFNAGSHAVAEYALWSIIKPNERVLYSLADVDDRWVDRDWAIYCSDLEFKVLAKTLEKYSKAT